MIGIAIMAHNFLSANMFAAVSDLFPDRQGGQSNRINGCGQRAKLASISSANRQPVDHSSYTPVFLLVGFMPLIGTISLFVFWT
jgi:hypothetical protein